MPLNPLPAGSVLQNRFEIESLLGRGGFSFAYLTKDHERGDAAVVKELAPQGSNRQEGGLVELESSEETAGRLRQRFLEEARLIAKLNVRGLLPVRAAFQENGTAYYATDHLATAKTLDALIRESGPMNTDGALDLFFQLLEIIEGVHAKGVLHRDIKPSNVLVTDAGTVYLIDFGAAREWQADVMANQTVMYSPGYAPPEQLSERARRGPATDIYALCATLYHALSGTPPIAATERVAGGHLRRLDVLRPNLDPAVAGAIEKGLSLPYVDRPQSIEELRELLAKTTDDPLEDLKSLDEKAVRLSRFTFGKRSCPACNGLLVEPKPLRSGICPVCRAGRIQKRDLYDRMCPACKISPLRPIENQSQPGLCPQCRFGVLSLRKKGLLSRDIIGTCLSCNATYHFGDQSMTRLTPEPREEKPFEEWLDLLNRGHRVWVCDGCNAQFDDLPDGRRAQMKPRPKGTVRAYFPDEWARIAEGLEPGSGNAECDHCGADYFIDGEWVTLVDADHDPHRFADGYLGRRLNLEDIRWVGAGKATGSPGFVCDQCHTEFDTDGIYLRLAHTDSARLRRHASKPHTLEDWHRIGQGLPQVGFEEDLEEAIRRELVQAYESGALSFDAAHLIAWKGPATRFDGNGAEGTLTIGSQEITFGGLLRKWRAPIDAVVSAEGDVDHLYLRISGEREPAVFSVTPIDLVAHLASGDRTITLTGANLARRLLAVC